MSVLAGSILGGIIGIALGSALVLVYFWFQNRKLRRELNGQNYTDHNRR